LRRLISYHTLFYFRDCVHIFSTDLREIYDRMMGRRGLGQLPNHDDANCTISCLHFATVSCQRWNI